MSDDFYVVGAVMVWMGGMDDKCMMEMVMIVGSDFNNYIQNLVIYV